MKLKEKKGIPTPRRCSRIVWAFPCHHPSPALSRLSSLLCAAASAASAASCVAAACTAAVSCSHRVVVNVVVERERADMAAHDELSFFFACAA